MKAHRRNHSNSDNWTEAQAAYQQGHPEKAAKLCKRLISRHPGHGDANNLLGVIALSQKNYSAARAAFGKAVACKPEAAPYHNNLGIALRGLQRLDDARQHYEQAIALQASYPDALFNLGNVLRDLGEDARAVEAYRQATEIQPDYHAAWNNLGNTLRTLVQPEEAVKAYRAALDLHEDAQTRSNLAFALREAGHKEDALDIQRRAVAAQPDNSALHFNLANALRDAELLDEAISHYRHALGLVPEHAGAANNLGTLWLNRDEPLAALECYRRAVYFEPANADYLANVSNAERALKRYGRAANALRAAIAMKPDFAPFHFNLANDLREWQKREPAAKVTMAESESAYRRAIELKPDFAEAWNNLASLLGENNEDEKALAAYQQAIDLDPDNWEFHFNLAQRLHTCGDLDGSRSAFAAGLAIKEHAGGRIRYEISLPAIMESEKAVADTRAALAASFKKLSERKLEITDPMSDIAVAPLFYLAYHGECNADLMRSYTELIRATCPSVEYVAPHCKEPVPRANANKIRIGFASKFFQAHTIGKFFRGILKNLNQDLFEIFVFMVPTKQDDVTRWISQHADHFEVLPPKLAEARESIAEHQLDILVYTDIGMEPFTYYLSFSRLAPVQCVLYGHPDTTGIPTIDYYLSGGECESADADSHYTEKLVRLDPASTYTFYYRPEMRASQKARADLGLPESGNLYTCAQSMFKIHPEMDPVFDEILERDSKGHLLLFDDVSQRRIALFKTRMQKRMHHYDRIIFLPRMELPNFLQVLHLSDVLLDSFHFCGGNTSFDSFAAESPVVTLPGEFMRGRQTLGLYLRMGFTDLVASDKADYINKALHLGTDAEFRKAMRRELAARVPVIFEDPGIVRAMEKFFISVTP